MLEGMTTFVLFVSMFSGGVEINFADRPQTLERCIVMGNFVEQRMKPAQIEWECRAKMGLGTLTYDP